MMTWGVTPRNRVERLATVFQALGNESSRSLHVNKHYLYGVVSVHRLLNSLTVVQANGSIL